VVLARAERVARRTRRKRRRNGKSIATVLRAVEIVLDRPRAPAEVIEAVCSLGDHLLEEHAAGSGDEVPIGVAASTANAERR